MSNYAESILDTVREPLVVLDGGFRVRLANRSFYRTFAAAREETENASLFSLGGGQWDIPELRSLLANALARDELFQDYEVEREFPAIGRKTMLLNARRLYDEERREGMILLAIEDITERKRAEEARRRSERMLAHSQRMAQVGSWELDLARADDLDSNELRWSDETFRIFGYEPGQVEVTNGLFFRAVHPEDRPAVRQSVAEALGGRGAGRVDYRILRPDGAWRIVQGWCEALADPRGRPLRLIGTCQDITDRRRAEEDLDRFFELSADLLCIAGLDGYFKRLNPAWVRALGFPEQELLATPFIEFVHPEDRESTLAQVGGLAEGKLTVSFENRYRCQDGSYRWLLWMSAPSPERGLIYAVAHDITERKRAEEALRRSEEQLRLAQKLEAVGRLAGGIAHDFNNLLVAINGYSALALRKLREGDPLREYVSEIRDAGRRAGSLTSQLLAFSRRQVLQPQVLDLNAVVAEMERILGRLIGEDVELRTVLRPGLGSVKADPGQVEQIIMNLAVNARDAMPRGGKLTVETDAVYLDEGYARRHVAVSPGRYVMLAVSDTGTGMDEQTQRQIFEPFFTTKERGKGTGLGLSTVYGIVKQSGGSIWVYSEVGRGTTFKVYLPLVAEGAEAYRRPPEGGEVPPGTETILVAEDEAAVRSLVREALTAYGYRVITAPDGGSALLLGERHAGPIHLLLTDVVMPGVSGLELARRLGELRPGVRVLYMSGYTEDTISHHGILDAGVEFIQKPFAPEALARKVREVLDKAPAAQPQPRT
jgi:two-component system, cell cycle sensor histidine kinase and response regulator CckA